MKNTYEVRGDVTAIFLRRRDGSLVETLIDTCDFFIAASFPHRWYAHTDTSGTIYVHGKRQGRDVSKQLTLLHRLVTDAWAPRVVDHINGNGLDNRRSNLRVVTQVVNQLNRRGAARSSASGVRGVWRSSQSDCWLAVIGFHGQKHQLGCYASIDDAAAAYERAHKQFMAMALAEDGCAA